METLNFTREQIVWQEVPGEVSLAFLFSGCPLRCKGCHSADSWKGCLGTELTAEYLQSRLERYCGLISCVLFMGGEWLPEKLLPLLAQIADLHGDAIQVSYVQEGPDAWKLKLERRS